MLLWFGGALYRWRRAVLVGWGLLLLVALPVAPRVFQSLAAGGFSSPDLEAFRASQLLADRFGANPSNFVLVYDDPTSQLTPDDRAQYATITLSPNADNVRQVVPNIERTLRQTSLHVTLTGAPVFYQDIFDVTERDLRRAELLSIPTAGIALILVFGSVVAGAVPGLVGGTAVAVTLACMVVLSQFFELSIFSLNLATML